MIYLHFTIKTKSRLIYPRSQSRLLKKLIPVENCVRWETSSN